MDDEGETSDGQLAHEFATKYVRDRKYAPHLEPCDLSAGFLAGLAKGCEMERERIITICEGYHQRDPVHNIAGAIIQAIQES